MWFLQIVYRNDLCFELPPLSSAPHPFVPQSPFMQIFPLQTDSGFHYVNSLPVQMLSKQIFSRVLQKEEVVNNMRSRNQLSALIVGRTASREGCVPVHRYCTFCSGVWSLNQKGRSVFTHTYLQQVRLHISVSARWPLCTGTPFRFHAFVPIFSLESRSRVHLCACVCVCEFSI